MKIGISSYSFAHYQRDTHASYLKLCDLAREIGFDGIEFIDLDPEYQPAADLCALADEIRAHCEAIGLPIIAYTVGADFIENPDMVAQLKAKIDVAGHLGAKVVRHDVTWRRDLDWREIIARTKDSVREVTEYAARKGIRTCTENHGYVMQDANRVEELILAVNHPNYGWLVDMGNFLCADEPSMHALPIAAKYAFHAHAKDFLLKSEKPSDEWFPTRNGNFLRGTVVGHGVVPVRECVKTLRGAGYDGWLSLEFEGMEDNLPALRAGLSYLRSVTE